MIAHGELYKHSHPAAGLLIANVFTGLGTLEMWREPDLHLMFALGVVETVNKTDTNQDPETLIFSILSI